MHLGRTNLFRVDMSDNNRDSIASLSFLLVRSVCKNKLVHFGKQDITKIQEEKREHRKNDSEGFLRVSIFVNVCDKIDNVVTGRWSSYQLEHSFI